MESKLSSHVRSNVVGYIALVAAVVGVPMAFALGKNSVGPKQIKPNAVRSSEVKNEALKGADVNESTLGQVPAAATADSASRANSADTADSADTANSANTANDANTVGGLAVREINYSANPNTGAQQILSLAGLQLSASCSGVADTALVATTTKDDSSLFVGGMSTSDANDTDGLRDIRSGDIDNNEFDVGVTFDVDAVIGEGEANREFGSLYYFSGDGATVTIDLVFDEFGITECRVKGTAIGG